MVDDVTRDGRTVINAWLDATQTHERKRKDLSLAGNEVTRTERELIRWICPSDVKLGEKIAVWSNDSLVQVHVTTLHPLDGDITIRTRGRDIGR